MSRLPNFIIIGAGKCGTTSLHDYLNQHPQIYICPKKETFFFINEVVRSKYKPWGAVTDIEDYRALFADAAEDSVIGEISTNYYAHPESAQLIYNLIPEVKIIAILRDPAERAFSSYQMHVIEGLENRDFARIIDKDIKYVKRGFYCAQLRPFFNRFDRHQIKIFLYDDLCKDPTLFIQDLFRYIEIDPNFIPNMNKRGREGGLPKNKALHNIVTKKNILRTFIASMLKLFMPLELRQKIRSNLVKDNRYKAKLSADSRNKLIEIYRSDILQLQDLIQRDLSGWLA